MVSGSIFLKSRYRVAKAIGVVLYMVPDTIRRELPGGIMPVVFVDKIW